MQWRGYHTERGAWVSWGACRPSGCLSLGCTSLLLLPQATEVRKVGEPGPLQGSVGLSVDMPQKHVLGEGLLPQPGLTLTLPSDLHKCVGEGTRVLWGCSWTGDFELCR